MTPAVLYLRRSRLFRSMTAADIAACTAGVHIGSDSVFWASVVVVFVAAWVGFEKWCRRKGWGKLSDYPEARRQKRLRWLLNLSAYSLINVLLIWALDCPWWLPA